MVRIKYGKFSLQDFRTYFPDSPRLEKIEQPDAFGYLAQQWLDSTDVGLNTRDQYKKLLNKYWMPLFCERPVGSISYRELRVTISQIPWTSAKTRNNALIPLRGVFDMAAEDEIIDRDPAAKLKNQKHQKPTVDPFLRDEAEIILK